MSNIIDFLTLERKYKLTKKEKAELHDEKHIRSEAKRLSKMLGNRKIQSKTGLNGIVTYTLIKKPAKLSKREEKNLEKQEKEKEIKNSEMLEQEKKIKKEKKENQLASKKFRIECQFCGSVIQIGNKARHYNTNKCLSSERKKEI